MGNLKTKEMESSIKSDIGVTISEHSNATHNLDSENSPPGGSFSRQGA